MFTRATKDIALSGVGLAFDSCCVFYAVQSDNEWNDYLANILTLFTISTGLLYSAA